jgi:hypothetical protein
VLTPDTFEISLHEKGDEYTLKSNTGGESKLSQYDRALLRATTTPSTAPRFDCWTTDIIIKKKNKFLLKTATKRFRDEQITFELGGKLTTHSFTFKGQHENFGKQDRMKREERKRFSPCTLHILPTHVHHMLQEAN